MPTELSFSQERIAKLTAPAKGRVYYRDNRLPGLQICVTCTGRKTYYFARRIDGRYTRIRLGVHPQVTVEQARNAAQDLVGQIANGRDPATERQHRRQVPSLHELWEHWRDKHAKPKKRTWRDDERQFNKYMRAWHGRKLNLITQADVLAWHRKLGEKHGQYQANRAISLLSAMYNKAGEMGYSGTNPCDTVTRFAEHTRERFLQPSEIKRFFSALAKEKPLWRDFFMLCLFTGARRGNVAAMEWTEIDLDLGIWQIPGTKVKNGRPMVIALVTPAAEILQRRLDDREGACVWVFPSQRSDGRIIDPRKAWERVLAASEIKNLRMHDLRRSLGSWMVASGASVPMVGGALGHLDAKATAVYARLKVEPIRAAVKTATDAMLAAGGSTLLLTSDPRQSDGQDGEDSATPSPPATP